MDDLEAMEKEVVLQMNRVRHDPAGYAAQYLVPVLKMFRGKLLERPGQIAIETREGRKALKECIAVLQKTQAMPILRPVVGLCRAARDHALDIGIPGIVSHTGSDGSSPFDRMERYGVWKKTAAENIDYGSRTAEEIVYSLLVDDGVPSRAHRQTLLNPDFLVTGVSIKLHKKYGQCWVITYAAQYGDPPPKRKLRRNL
ncbi:MAG: CAP domain-containing protein [Candidatus Delongbacteria bacterium]|nr:CAP domain-containing protein [Candidatus Delongbacteria bacterium]